MKTKEHKYLIITFDYELFLGKRSGSVDKCVIEPTQKILDILLKYNALAVFFVDTAWLVRLKEEAANSPVARKDYDKVAQQLQKMAKDGHYIFNHLHPHWLDARYYKETNNWELSDTKRYRFAALDNTSRATLFEKTANILEEIIRPVLPGYKAEGYRGGGWSIQPFTDFAPYFRQYGIRYDFSVMPGMKSVTSAQQYDYTTASNYSPYTFSDDPSKAGKGDFTEYPISNISESYMEKQLNRILLKYLWKKGDKGSGDGSGIAPEVFEQVTSGKEMVSIELITRIKLPSYLRYLKEHDYMQFISHPKMLSEHNINTFAKFIKVAFARYAIETDFKKIPINA